MHLASFFDLIKAAAECARPPSSRLHQAEDFTDGRDAMSTRAPRTLPMRVRDFTEDPNSHEWSNINAFSQLSRGL
jgi:hypothetical protein